MKDEEINAFMEDFSNSEGELKKLWDSIPLDKYESEPNLEETTKFAKCLRAYQEGFNDGLNTVKIKEQPLQTKTTPFPLAPISVAAILFLSLISSSFYMIYRSEHKESTELQKLLALTLIQQNTVPQRIDGVRFASQLEGTGSDLENELILILNHDPSTNVRLSALNALRSGIVHPHLRKQFIESISKQTSPLVAMSLCQEILKIAPENEYDAVIKQIESSCIDSKRAIALKNSLSTHI